MTAGIRRFLAHVFDRVLVAEPVRAFDGVVHVPAPVVLAHVSERRAHTALRCHGVAAGRENLGYTGGGEPLGRQAEGRPKSGAARAHHRRERDREQLRRDQCGELHPFRVNVVLDDHLQSELRVVEEGRDGQEQGDGDRGGADPLHRAGVVRGADRDQRGHEPDGEGNERDGGDPLHPPVVRPVLTPAVKQWRAGSVKRSPQRLALSSRWCRSYFGSISP